MKRFCWTILLMSALILTGCGSPSNVAVSSTPSTVATASAPTNASNPGSVSASVNVVPAQQSNLGFIISAPVKEVDIKEGDQVKAGQVLMVLDTPDLTNAVATDDRGDARNVADFSAELLIERLNGNICRLPDFYSRNIAFAQIGGFNLKV